MSEWFNIPVDLLTDTVVLATMILGLLSLLIPIIPGLVIIWIAALGYGIITGFTTLGWVMFAIMSVLMVGGSFVDNVLMGTQAHKQGASWLSVLVALVAAVLGNFVIPIIGGVLAALGALLLAEYLRRKNWDEALTATKGMAMGCGWAVAIRFIIGMLMIGLWMIWAWT